jgi:hypothetical protein
MNSTRHSRCSIGALVLYSTPKILASESNNNVAAAEKANILKGTVSFLKRTIPILKTRRSNK